MSKKKKVIADSDIPKKGDSIYCLNNCDNYIGVAVVDSVDNKGYVSRITRPEFGGWGCWMNREDYEFDYDKTKEKDKKFLLCYTRGGNQVVSTFSKRELVLKRVHSLISSERNKGVPKIDPNTIHCYQILNSVKLKVATEIKISEE